MWGYCKILQVITLVARQYAVELYGKTIFDQSLVDQWIDLMQHFQLEQEPDKERVTSTLKSLDSLAPKSKFLVGGNLTLADLFLIQSTSHAFSCVRFNIQTEEEVRKKQKAIFKWYGQIMTTPQISQLSTELGLLTVAAQKEQKEVKQQVSAQPKKEAQVNSLVHILPEKSWGGRYRIQYVLENWENYIDQIILVAGWTKTIRFQGNEKIAFIELNDGSTVENIQIVVDNCMEEFSKLKNSANGGSLKVKGKVIRSLGQGQHIEMQVNDVKEHFCKVVGTCDQSEYPLSKKDHKMETLRTIAHLRPRTQIMSAIMRVRNACAFATHKFFQERGFLYIHTPIITASDCEGAGEMFQVSTIMPPQNKTVEIDYSKEFFTRPAFLTVSGQLAVENYACALCDVYTFGPTFRAENSHTSRHLAEFWMIEPEICFAELEDDMECAEAYLKFCVEYCLTNLMNDLKFFEEKCEKGLIARLQNVVQNNFARITYTEAIELVNACPDKQTKFKTVPQWGEDMNSEHERYIAEELIKGPVIVYNYPKEFKAFYMKLNEDNKTVRAMDILVPKIGEVIGGSQREDNLERLDEMLRYKNLKVEDYWWYRDLRKYGTVPHAGFGLGFERLVMMITGVENIRDVIPYPRYPGHAEF